MTKKDLFYVVCLTSKTTISLFVIILNRLLRFVAFIIIIISFVGSSFGPDITYTILFLIPHILSSIILLFSLEEFYVFVIVIPFSLYHLKDLLEFQIPNLNQRENIPFTPKTLVRFLL